MLLASHAVVFKGDRIAHCLVVHSLGSECNPISPKNDCVGGYDVVGCKTRVKSVNSNWSVSIRLLLVKLSRSVRGLFVGFVYVVN